ncbi:MAG TPA: nucleoside-triphosphatase [Aggregatilineales bacterium]|nr:nucleoside-triphosphatase [Aggregatilineales bacterium]
MDNLPFTVRGQPQGDKPVMLLTGPPGIGKSTIVQAVIERLGNDAGGFYVRAPWVDGRRDRFELVTLSGETATLALESRASAFPREVDFDVFKVNLDAVEGLAIDTLEVTLTSKKVVIVDELGPMQFVSNRFKQLVWKILTDPSRLVFGTIVERPYPFADDLKKLARVQLIPVTLTNRDALPSQLMAQLQRYL